MTISFRKVLQKTVAAGEPSLHNEYAQRGDAQKTYRVDVEVRYAAGDGYKGRSDGLDMW